MQIECEKKEQCEINVKICVLYQRFTCKCFEFFILDFSQTCNGTGIHCFFFQLTCLPDKILLKAIHQGGMAT